MPHDFHFEVKKDRILYKIMIHDENKNRVNNILFEKLFFKIFKKFKNLKISKFDNKLEACIYVDFENIKFKIIEIYKEIKYKINVYIKCEEL